MITIKNSQQSIPINITSFTKDAQTILDVLGYHDFDLGIWITTNKTIQQYNKTYRNKDKPTDILSFAFHPNLKAGATIKPITEDDKNLGDLIISAEYVQKDAEKLGVTFETRMKVLLVHGICHLLGYDHENDKDYEIMKEKEEALLNILPKKTRKK